VEWKILYKSLEAYRESGHRMLQQLSRALEVALDSEEQYSLSPNVSKRFQARMDRLSTLFDQDYEVLSRVLLRPFDTVKLLPAPSVSSKIDRSTDATSIAEDTPTRQCSTTTAATTTTISSSASFSRPLRRNHTDYRHHPQPYDSVNQVVAHVVRDWSMHGQPIRSSLYDWCIQHIHTYIATTATATSVPGAILIPGAGLGRLVWDAAVELQGTFRVEAVEQSVVMASMTAALWQQPSLEFQLHPFAHDFLTHEVDSENRYEAVSFPDGNGMAGPPKRPPPGSLLYVVADFVSTYAHAPEAQAAYDIVITCFFIDTARNIYDYLHTIRSVLKTNGVWINVGPLQWHGDSQVPLCANELRVLLEQFDFDIETWSVDEQPMEYRHRIPPSSVIQSTLYEA
jgi:hypothetical protein